MKLSKAYRLSHRRDAADLDGDRQRQPLLGAIGRELRAMLGETDLPLPLRPQNDIIL